MSEITEEKYNEMKQKAVDFFGKNKIILSPAFGEIKVTSKGFSHIEWKNKNHKRPKKESYIRYLCFLHIGYVLNNSKLYQEFREYMENVEIKKKGKKKIEKRMANLYGFVAIVNHNENRIKNYR